MGEPIPSMKSSGGYNYPATPRQQVVDLVGLLDAPADILDIGAGFGNNCIPLLDAGHTVTATETNKECIAYLRGLRSQYPGQLKVVEAPVQALTTAKSFDAVVCTMVLHFLTQREAEHAIHTMQAVTREGGYNVITNYLTGQEIGDEYTWLLESQELPGYYKNWKIVSYEESYPLTLGKIQSARQLVRWLLGRRGYKSARLIARR